MKREQTPMFQFTFRWAVQLVWGFRVEAKDLAWIGTKTYMTYFI